MQIASGIELASVSVLVVADRSSPSPTATLAKRRSGFFSSHAAPSACAKCTDALSNSLQGSRILSKVRSPSRSRQDREQCASIAGAPHRSHDLGIAHPAGDAGKGV